jgi:uncharacterized membrane protein
MMKRLSRYFLQGLIYLAPVAITLFVVYRIFTFTDNLLREVLASIFGIVIPGLGILIIIIFLTFLGFVGQTIIARPFKKLFNRLIRRVPMLELIYSAVNDFLSAVVGKQKKFNRPALVKVNAVTNLEKLGFITDEDLSIFGLSDKVVVYFPHSYNFSGETFIVPIDQVTPLNLPPSEVMKFVVSGGVADIDLQYHPKAGYKGL